MEDNLSLQIVAQKQVVSLSEQSQARNLQLPLCVEYEIFLDLEKEFQYDCCLDCIV